MRLFLAGFYEQTYKKCFSPEVMKASCILGSYFYLNNRKFTDKFDPTAIRDFMFDSGAFTYIHATGNNVNWKEYARRYAPEGAIWLEMDGKWGLMDLREGTAGQWRTEPTYDSVYSGGIAKLGNRWVAVDDCGRAVSPLPDDG